MLTQKNTPTHGCTFYDTPHGRVYGVPARPVTPADPHAEYWARGAAQTIAWGGLWFVAGVVGIAHLVGAA